MTTEQKRTERRRRKWTEGVLAASAVGLLGWELVTLVRRDDDKRTISEVVTEVAFDFPMLPFGVGLLCGHWFWRPRPAPRTPS